MDQTITLECKNCNIKEEFKASEIPRSPGGNFIAMQSFQFQCPNCWNIILPVVPAPARKEEKMIPCEYDTSHGVHGFCTRHAPVVFSNPYWDDEGRRADYRDCAGHDPERTITLYPDAECPCGDYKKRVLE
jgi:hypothetical protein